MIYTFLKHPAIRLFLPAFLIAALVFAPAYHAAQASPIIQVVAVAVLGGIIGVVIACALQFLDLCKPGSSGATGSSGGPGGVTVVTPGGKGKGGGSGRGGSGSGSGSSGSGGGASCSVSNPVCPSVTSLGTIVNGVCNASVPPNSSCPAPVIASGTFKADPSIVKKGNTTSLFWNVTNATLCGISGGGLSLSGLPIASNINSPAKTQPIAAKTIYTLTCQNGGGGPSSSAQATVNLDPSFQEI